MRGKPARGAQAIALLGQWSRSAVAVLSASVTPQRAWSPRVAAGLSLVIPGAGQVYKGQIVLGLLWFVAVVAGYVALVVPGVILQGICVVTAATGPTNRPQAAAAGSRGDRTRDS